MIYTGSDFSGIGAFEQALIRLGVEHRTVFACDMDRYARQTYVENNGTKKDIELAKMPIPSNFAVALGKPDSKMRELLKEFAHPEEFSFYYPYNVYHREIPKEPLDVYMTSPPCQAFSLAGKRKGEDDHRGILFYNSHEFIQKNRPRYFIFENVKGLLSDDEGKTFQRWLDYLGGKSVNGNPLIFPHPESVPYHIYWQVLNAKDYGVPQNRERVFIIGIRDDQDNSFTFPRPFHLEKRLKDVLEDEVDEKYYLSDDAIKRIEKSKFSQDFKDDDTEYTGCLTAGYFKIPSDVNYLQIKSATSKGYETATDEDSINFSQPNSETRRGRVGKGVAQTLDTSCNQGVIQVVAFGRGEEEKKRRKEHFRKTGKDSGSFKDKELICKDQEYYDTILASPNPQKEGLIAVQKDNMVVTENYIQWDSTGKNHKSQYDRAYKVDKLSGTVLTTNPNNILLNDYRIRRLTPRECFRLMDFPDTFTWTVSDTQAYKQAGNSIVVSVLCEILKKLINQNNGTKRDTD